ncbi:MAG: transporter substrate-binding protein, partial [Burkholderiaceae bacterium]
RAGSIAAPAVRAALSGVALTAPSGATVRMSRINHCLQRPLMVGRARRDGLFDVVARSDD